MLATQLPHSSPYIHIAAPPPQEVDPADELDSGKFFISFGLLQILDLLSILVNGARHGGKAPAGGLGEDGLYAGRETPLALNWTSGEPCQIIPGRENLFRICRPGLGVPLKKAAKSSGEAEELRNYRAYPSDTVRSPNV